MFNNVAFAGPRFLKQYAQDSVLTNFTTFIAKVYHTCCAKFYLMQVDQCDREIKRLTDKATLKETKGRSFRAGELRKECDEPTQDKYDAQTYLEKHLKDLRALSQTSYDSFLKEHNMKKVQLNGENCVAYYGPKK